MVYERGISPSKVAMVGGRLFIYKHFAPLALGDVDESIMKH